MFDILIKKGTVFSGDFKEPLVQDIGINRDKIVALGDLKKEKGKKEIDASGLYVSPGFIEIDSIADRDLSLFHNWKAVNFISQGVTTVIGGACGASLSPVLKYSLDSLGKWTNYETLNIDWHSTEEFFRYISQKKPAVNLGFLVSWATLRNAFTQQQFRQLSQEEKEKLKQLLEESFRAGVLGVTFGYGFEGEKAVSIDEILNIAPIIKKYRGYIAFNLRDIFAEFLVSLEEIKEVIEKSGLSGEIYQFIPVQSLTEKEYLQGLQLIEKVNKERELLNFDIMPYQVMPILAQSLLPDWTAIGGRKVLLQNIKNEVFRKKIIADLKQRKVLSSELIIARCGDKNNWWLIGKTLQEIADNFHTNLEDAFIRLFSLYSGNITVFYPVISVSYLEKAITSPFSFISSKGSFFNSFQNTKNGFLPHPASFGAFPRFLKKFVREEKLLTWSEALYKISGKVAQKIGLKKRGFIKKDYQADIVIFHPDKITDQADFHNPYQPALGIEAVLINGKIVYQKGREIEENCGLVLKRK